MSSTRSAQPAPFVFRKQQRVGHYQGQPLIGKPQRGLVHAKPTYLNVARRSSSVRKPKTFALVAAKPAQPNVGLRKSHRVVTLPSKHYIVDVLNYSAMCFENLPFHERKNYRRSRDQHKLCLIDFVKRCLENHKKTANKKSKGHIEVSIRRPVIHFCTKYHTTSQLEHWKQMNDMLHRLYSPSKVIIEMYVVRGDSKCIDPEFNRKNHVNCEPDDYIAVALYNVLCRMQQTDAAGAQSVSSQTHGTASAKPRAQNNVFLVSRDGFRDAVHVADVYAPKFANGQRSIHFAHKRSADLIRAFSQQYAAAKPADRKLIVPQLKDRPFI